MTQARSFWTVAAGRGEIRSETLPEPGPSETLVRTLASGVSRGTEALVFQGRVPPSQYAAMRAPMMAGAFPFPVKYGYSAVGMSEGRRIFALHPHQDAFLAPRSLCIPVPDTVPTPRAVLAANMETALNLVWDATPLAGERVLVVGAGTLGLLAAALIARFPAAQVTVTDLDPGRAPLARRFGCSFAPPGEAPDGCELIVHTSASEPGLRLALERAGFEARVVEASWYGDQNPTVPLGEAFHARRLRLISTQVGALATPMRNRRTHADRLAAALDLLQDDAFDGLLQGPTAFERLPDTMPGILRPGGLCHVISYGNGGCTA